MALDPMTNEVMRRLPAGLRPNPYNLQEVVMNLTSDGWDPSDIFAGIMADKPREPGHVIAAARRLRGTPAPSSGQGWVFGHTMCENPTHVDCQICRCHRGVIQHMVPVSMPDWVRSRYRTSFAGFGEVPNE